MLGLPPEPDVLAKLTRWAEADPSIRALVLTSSRARQDGSADELSDYDVVLAVRDAAGLAATDGWQAHYGGPLVRWGDEHEVEGLATYFRGVVYEDGVRVDYSLWPAELVDRVACAERLPDDLDVGYRVLVDKDGGTARWQAPTFRAHVPARPTDAEYRALVEEFWWDTTYVAKSLRRGEVFFAKFMLDFDAKFVALRKLLEWRVELDRDWSYRPGSHGRGLERDLPEEVWAELASTYVGTGIDENWEALDRLVALFRRLAREVASALGHAYPEDVDRAMVAHLRAVRALGPAAARSGAA